jgi:hypothetical protein
MLDGGWEAYCGGVAMVGDMAKNMCSRRGRSRNRSGRAEL